MGRVELAPWSSASGLPFLYSLASPLIGGVGRDARYVGERIASRSSAQQLPSVTTSLRVSQHR